MKEIIICNDGIIIRYVFGSSRKVARVVTHKFNEIRNGVKNKVIKSKKSIKQYLYEVDP